MALYWNFNEKIGEIKSEIDGKLYTFNLYKGNAYLIILFEYKQEDKDMYQMHSFFADEQHAKNMLGLSKGYDENYFNGRERWLEIKLNKDYQYLKSFVSLLIKAFDNIKIEIYKDINK